MYTLTFPVPSRERVLLRLFEAERTDKGRPTKIHVNPADYRNLRQEMRRYGYTPRDDLDVLFVPIVPNEDVRRYAIGFTWEPLETPATAEAPKPVEPAHVTTFVEPQPKPEPEPVVETIPEPARVPAKPARGVTRGRRNADPEPVEQSDNSLFE